MSNPSLGSAMARQTQRPALALMVPVAVELQLGLTGGLDVLVLTLKPPWGAAGKASEQALVWVVFRQVCLEIVL